MYTDVGVQCQCFTDVGVHCDVDVHSQLSADVGVQCQCFRGTSTGFGGRADTCKKLPDGFEFSSI